MRDPRPDSVSNIVGCLAAAICLCAVMTDTTLARQGPPEGSRDPVLETRRMSDRETRLRVLDPKLRKSRTPDPRRVQAALAQFAEDFERIQVIRNEIAGVIKAKKEFDYKLLSNQAAGINKRAKRLKVYLIPQDLEGDEKDQKDQAEFSNEQMREAVIKLCNSIHYFVENPFFKFTDTVNAEEAVKVRQDLQGIIELSGGIKKSAEKLNKSK